MVSSSLLGFALLSLSLPFATVASSHVGPAHHRRHEAIAAQVNSTAVNTTETQLHRRGQTFTGARLTYYDVGLGACGKTNVPSDFSYGGGYPGPNCFRPIEITYNGKTAQATIMDECPGCPSPGGLDLSSGLFSYLAPLSEGVLYASWRYTDEGDEPAPAPTTTSSKWEAPSTTWTPPTTTSSKQHKTTSTWSPEPTPTSTWSPEPSTSSTWSSSSSWSSSSVWSSLSSSSTWTPSSSSSSHTSSSATSSASVVAAASATPVGPDTLNNLNQAFLGLAEIMIAGAQAN
ncbi:hypothetical protein C8Q79DRAFT_999985 [Trametes meyenii]|nr:hypothetical protein C8Q79DRAFT_999985 [Trametes meyenii]